MASTFFAFGLSPNLGIKQNKTQYEFIALLNSSYKNILFHSSTENGNRFATAGIITSFINNYPKANPIYTFCVICPTQKECSILSATIRGMRESTHVSSHNVHVMITSKSESHLFSADCLFMLHAQELDISVFFIPKHYTKLVVLYEESTPFIEKLGKLKDTKGENFFYKFA